MKNTTLTDVFALGTFTFQQIAEMFGIDKEQVITLFRQYEDLSMIDENEFSQYLDACLVIDRQAKMITL